MPRGHGLLFAIAVAACWGPPPRERPVLAEPEPEPKPASEPGPAPAPAPIRPRREPPPSPPANMQPIGHHTPIWRLDDPHVALVDADAAHVVVQRYRDGGHELALHDVVDGRELARARAFQGAWSRRAVSPALVDARTLLVVTGAELVALDVPDLRERWRVAFVQQFDWIGQERAIDARVLMQPDTMGILLRDLATGRELWRRADRTPPAAPSLLDADRVYVHDLHHFVAGLDRDDGRELWRQALPGQAWDHHWQIVLAGDAIAAVGGEVLRFDRATGRLLSRYPAGAHPQAWHAATFHADTLYLSSVDATEALDPATGAPIWTRPGAMGPLVATADALIGCGDGSIVRVLARPTGAEGWRHGLARCADVWPGDLAWWRVATGTRLGDILLLRTPTGLIAHARVAATTTPGEDVTIRGTTEINGRRRGGVAVHVGDRVVRSDRRGDFSVRLPDMRGVLSLEITADEAARVARRPCGSEARSGVALTGAGSYTVVASAQAHDYECDRACRCD